MKNSRKESMELKNYTECICFENEEWYPIEEEVEMKIQKPKLPLWLKIGRVILCFGPLGWILALLILIAQIGFDVYAFMNLF